MSNELIITIAGKANSGKSMMMYQLEKLLQENGYNVELSFENHTDYGGENSYFFRKKMLTEFKDNDEIIKNNTKIILKETQLPRGKV